MQSMVYGVMFKANDVSHTIVCSPLVGIHDRARQNMALYYWQERFGVSERGAKFPKGGQISERGAKFPRKYGLRGGHIS